MAKDGPKLFSRNRGGLRIPSEELLDKEILTISKEYRKKCEVIRHTRPKKLHIYKGDIDRLRWIGGGSVTRGFDRMLKLAKVIHLNGIELITLTKLGKGNAREGLLYAIQAGQEKKEKAENMRSM